MKTLNPCISDWQGRCVWIVGASSGIGAALAGHLREAGAILALSARRENALREVAGDKDLAVPVDVSDAEALSPAFDLLLDRWGGVDMVIYCAAVYTPMRAWEIDLAVMAHNSLILSTACAATEPFPPSSSICSKLRIIRFFTLRRNTARVIRHGSAGSSNSRCRARRCRSRA